MTKKKKLEHPGRNETQQFVDKAFHGWYDFVLGYPDHLVSHLIDELELEAGATVLDPFCGTGTTLIESSKRGLTSIGLDANPFAVFAARVKTSFNLDATALERAATRVEGRYEEILASRRRFKDEDIYSYLDTSGMIDRGWISPEPLRKALALREAIRKGRIAKLNDPLLLALVADLPDKIGNMKFGPQIYRGPIKINADPLLLFRKRIEKMAVDLRHASETQRLPSPRIHLGDSRQLKKVLQRHSRKIPKIDAVICSPPYPTEHDYTRHMRLELAFTEGVSTHECLRRIKKSMIRSHTKGIYKGDDDMDAAKDLRAVQAVARRVEKAIAGKESGFEKLYPTVVRSYFGGMKRHFACVFEVLKSGGKAAYVVGDQAAYLRVPIKTAELLGEAAIEVGFKVTSIKQWRRRWSTGIGKFLDENILMLEKP